MPQIEQNSNPVPASTIAPSTGGNPSRDQALGEDPLAHLHKMSTTAGLGSAEYVAVSGLAIFCVITGLASALALMDNLLLILPLACIITAFFAVRQISRSNGTQTGKGLVALGVICALVFGGYVIVRDATAGIRTRADRQVIGQVVEQFGEKIKGGDFTGAYALFSDHFHDRVTQQEFNDKIKPFREGPIIGKLLGTSWNGLADFGLDNSTAVVNIEFKFEKNKPYSALAYFRKQNGKWLLDDLPDFFPPQQAPKR
jgi:hypothetical protein